MYYQCIIYVFSMFLHIITIYFKVTANQAKTKETCLMVEKVKEGLYPKPFLSKIAPEHEVLRTCKP